MKVFSIISLILVIGCNSPSGEIKGTWNSKWNQEIEFKENGIFTYTLDTNDDGIKDNIHQKYSTFIKDDTSFIIWSFIFDDSLILSDTSKFKIVNDQLYLASRQETIDSKGKKTSKKIPYNSIYTRK
jgi:hypothetical protein